ncbi:MAG TPA: glycoside hydrolase family 88 protein [Candidatus Acidoferrum sp.]|nr:glycoside hydrolase family 88 protein [Candidatus Acidoferrum sp.]
MNHVVIAALMVAAFLPLDHSFGAPAQDAGISDSQIRDIVQRVAKHQIHPLADGVYPGVTNLDIAKSAEPPEGIAWSYPWGIALFGVEREADALSDVEAGRFVAQHNFICARYYHWLDGLEKRFGDDGKAFARGTKIKPLISLGNLDSCGAMGNEILNEMILHPETASPAEKEVVDRIADWVVHKQERMPDGTLWRQRIMGGTVWPDDLYMGGVFLVRWGVYNHDQKFVDDAAQQIIHQAALEQDADGLWFHGYFVAQKQHAPFKWGRGNGWVTVTLVETLSAMDENDPLRPQLIDILRKQIDGLKKVQAADGMWRQVLDKPDLWEETSCTAMFAYGIARAVNRGWIDPDNMLVARKAFAGIAKNVTEDGVVKGTCQGTNIGMDPDYYINRSRPDDDPHGRGPVLLAGTEILAAGQKVAAKGN